MKYLFLFFVAFVTILMPSLMNGQSENDASSDMELITEGDYTAFKVPDGFVPPKTIAEATIHAKFLKGKTLQNARTFSRPKTIMFEDDQATYISGDYVSSGKWWIGRAENPKEYFRIFILLDEETGTVAYIDFEKFDIQRIMSKGPLNSDGKPNTITCKFYSYSKDGFVDMAPSSL